MSKPENNKNTGIFRHYKALIAVIIVFAVLMGGSYYWNQFYQQEQAVPITEEEPEFATEPAEVPPIAERKPPAPPPKVALPKIGDLRNEYANDDIVAYLEIDGTNIAYPVVQTSDNEFYLNHDIYGEESIAGAVFMDYENTADSAYDFSDNTVIYGHNMRDGSMFHDMRYYGDIKYFQEHPQIKLTTLYDETYWDIFSFYETTTDFYYIQTSFKNKQDFLSLILQMKLKSKYDTGITADENDKVLTLSTCANEGGDNRYVLNAKLSEK